MHQAVQTRLQLHKRAEGGDADNLALDDGAFRILLLGHVPRLRLKRLQAQLDALLFLVHTDDLHGHFLTRGHDLGRMLHAMPGQIGHMDEAIHAADVHERAEVGQAANDAGHDLILLDLLPSLLLLVEQIGLAAGDDALLRLVHLDDLDGHRLAHELADVLDEAAGQVRSRNERTNAHHVGDQATVDGLTTRSLHIGALVVFGNELLPVLGGHDLALGKEHIAFAIVELDDLSLDLVVHLAVGGHQIILLDETVSLAGNAHDNTVVAHLGDNTFNNLTGAELDHRFLEHRGKVFALGNLILFHVVHAGTTSSSISIRLGRR